MSTNEAITNCVIKRMRFLQFALRQVRSHSRYVIILSVKGGQLRKTASAIGKGPADRTGFANTGLELQSPESPPLHRYS